jgi:hypothetical protein
MFCTRNGYKHIENLDKVCVLIGRKVAGLLAPQKRERDMKEHLSDNCLAIGIIAVILILFGFAGSADMEDRINDELFYCEMVQIFEDSKGENGWPNFKGIDCE